MPLRMTFNNNSIIKNIEPWFIPFDILMILCSTLAIGLALIFLIIIIFDKTFHTVPMMLLANSCLAELIFASDMFGMALFTFENDIKQIQYGAVRKSSDQVGGGIPKSAHLITGGRGG